MLETRDNPTFQKYKLFQDYVQNDVWKQSLEQNTHDCVCVTQNYGKFHVTQ